MSTRFRTFYNYSVLGATLLLVAACGDGTVFNARSVDADATKTAALPSCARPQKTVLIEGSIADLPGGMGKIPNDPTQPLAEMLKSTGCFTVVQHSHTMQQEMARAGGRIPTVDYVLRPKVDNKSNGAASTFGSFGLAAVGTALTFLVPPVGLASLVVANGVKTDNIEVVLNVGEPRTGEEWRLTGASSNVRIVHAFAYSWGADNPELAKAVEDVVSKFSAKVLPASATAKPASAPVRTVATR